MKPHYKIIVFGEDWQRVADFTVENRVDAHKFRKALKGFGYKVYIERV